MYRSDSGAEKVDHQDECVMTENGADAKESIHAYKISRPPSYSFKNVSTSNKKSTHFDASHVGHTALRRTNSYSPNICPSSLSRKRVSRKISTSAPGADHHLIRSAKRHRISKDKARHTACNHTNHRSHSFSRHLFRTRAERGEGHDEDEEMRATSRPRDTPEVIVISDDDDDDDDDDDVIDLTIEDDDDAKVDSDDKERAEEEDTQCTGLDAGTKSIHCSPRTQTDVQESRHENAESLAPVTRFIRKEVDSRGCTQAASITPKRVDQSRAGIAQRDDHTRAATERARVECITKEKVVTESLVRVHCEAERVTKKRRETILITHVPHMGTARMARKGAWNFRKRQEVARVTRNIRHKKQVTHDRAWRARYEERKEATRKRAAAAIAADKKVTERTRVECITKEGAEAKKKQTVPSSSTDDVGVNSHEICSQDLPELFTTEQAEEKQAEEKRKSRKRKRVSFDLTKNEVRRVPRRVKANNKAEAQRKAEAEARRRSRSHDHRSGFRPVCSYFLKGRCKFGDRCRNKHPACFAPTSAQI